MVLTTLIWLPALFALLMAFLPNALIRRVAPIGALATLVLAVTLLAKFDRDASGLQFLVDRSWISSLGIHYKLGIDGLNVLLITLTAVVFLAATVAASFKEWENPKLFFFHLAVAETAVLGAFCAQDLALFVAFFDLMLVPFYFLVGIWGGPNRSRATMKFVIYTLVGSLLMLVAAVATAVLAQQPDQGITFVLSDLQQIPLDAGTQRWLLLLFAAAFLVKMPAFPLHGWMPDGYKAMPLPVLAVFSGVLSKVAAYGFIKVALPLFPSAAQQFQTLFLILAIVSIIYGSVMAFTTTDARLVLGYSSLAQLGFISFGIFSLRPEGVQGALLQMVNHGIVVTALVLLLGVLAQRAGDSEDLRDMGGIAFRAPALAALFLIFALANLAIPGTANFVGEFLILLGVFKDQGIVLVAIASVGVVLASIYMLRAFIKAMHNRVGPKVESKEIAAKDLALLAPLAVVVIALGLYPQFVLRNSEGATQASVAAILSDSIPDNSEQVEQFKLEQTQLSGEVR